MKLANLKDIEYQHKISAVSSFNLKYLASVSAFKSPLNPLAAKGKWVDGGKRGESRETRPIGLQEDVGEEAQSERWEEFCGIKQGIN